MAPPPTGSRLVTLQCQPTHTYTLVHLYEEVGGVLKRPTQAAGSSHDLISCPPRPKHDDDGLAPALKVRTSVCKGIEDKASANGEPAPNRGLQGARETHGGGSGSHFSLI